MLSIIYKNQLHTDYLLEEFAQVTLRYRVAVYLHVRTMRARVDISATLMYDCNLTGLHVVAVTSYFSEIFLLVADAHAPITPRR